MVTEAQCAVKHRLLNWVVGTILVIVSATSLGQLRLTDSVSQAALNATQVKGDLMTYQAGMSEHQKAADEKVAGLQAQMNTRFTATDSKIDKLTEKVEKLSDKIELLTRKP